jgi:SSS family transporter
MLITFVALYLIVSVAIGLYAATKVRNTRDYVTAGRSLNIWVVTAMVFATWFGAETVLGIPATFIETDLNGLISDPFGAALCLILFGLFFARKLYKMNLMTLGDFYRIRFDGRVEVIASVAIALSYLGWVGAQMMALGVIFNVLSDGGISQFVGILIGAAIIILYTVFGGMYSVAFTTTFQMIVIVLGLSFIAWALSDMSGGVLPVVEHAQAADKFNFLPEMTSIAWLAFISGLLTLGLGSLAQQDVFQRANAAKNVKIAVWGTVLGGALYLVFSGVPMLMGYSAFLIDPDMVQRLLSEDAQLILPTLVKDHMHLITQIIFFGAVLAVIMSTASGTLLAPAVIISENLAKKLIAPDRLNDRLFLLMTRTIVLIFGLLVTLYALWSLNAQTSIHSMVENAYKVTLVLAFVPLVAGLYWSKATRQGAYASMLMGLMVWVPLEFTSLEETVGLPAHFAGFGAAMIAMIVASLAIQEPSEVKKTAQTQH